MRSFVAIELTEPCRRALRTAIETLQRLAPGVRWVRPESLHLTLKFIGATDEADLPRTIERLTAVAAGSGPFVMDVSGLSGFPPHGTPRVVHVELHEPTGTLMALQKAVEDAIVEELGAAREDRPFTAHVTLGRTKDRRDCPTVDELSAALKRQDFGQVSVESFVLMRSELRPGGAVYTPVPRFALGGRA